MHRAAQNTLSASKNVLDMKQKDIMVMLHTLCSGKWDVILPYHYDNVHSDREK